MNLLNRRFGDGVLVASPMIKLAKNVEEEAGTWHSLNSIPLPRGGSFLFLEIGC